MFLVALALIFSLCAHFLTHFAEADLPIHALSSDAIGLWRILETETLHENPQKCGSTLPNINSVNLKLGDYRKYLEDTYGTLNETILELVDERYHRRGEIPPRNNWLFLGVRAPNSGEQYIGTWTMVYDEGLSIDTGQKRYFGYFKYSEIENHECPMVMEGYQSNSQGSVGCYKTDPSEIRLGWFTKKLANNGKSTNAYGCFYAEKLKKDDHHSFVLDETAALPSYKESPSSGLWERKNYSQFTDLSPFRFLQMRKGVSFRSIHHSHTHKQEQLPADMFTRFMQTDDLSYYACKTRSVVNDKYKELELPPQWTWGDAFNGDRDHIQPFGQGQCGSCYAMASVYVFAKRFEILMRKLYPSKEFDELPRPSVQHLVKCSPFGQGCSGGFPYLMGKHLSEIGAVTESQMPYKASHDASEMSCQIDNGDSENRWFVNAYGYVGGCYECSSEYEIMKEVYHHGPVVAAIDAPHNLFFYSKGIFDDEPSNHAYKCDLPLSSLNGWEYTNHAIAIVGWGEEEVEGNLVKYWICRNTWGENWGVGGFFKVKRGVNKCGIESQAVYIDPDLSRGLAARLIRNPPT